MQTQSAAESGDKVPALKTPYYVQRPARRREAFLQNSNGKALPAGPRNRTASENRASDSAIKGPQDTLSSHPTGRSRTGRGAGGCTSSSPAPGEKDALGAAILWGLLSRRNKNKILGTSYRYKKY